MFGDKKPTINQELLPVSETTILEIPPHRRADEIGALRVSVNLTFLVVHLPKPPSQFINLFWNFRVVSVVIFPR
jgi:hypothetical protein